MLAFPTQASVSISRLPVFIRRPIGLVGLLLTLSAAFCPWRLGVTSGHSMEPTMRHGSLFVCDLNYYRTQPIRPGDIVVMRDQRGIWVKRVYAVGGDQFWTLKQTLESHVQHDPIVPEQRHYFTWFAKERRRKGAGDFAVVQLKVPNHSVFVVGDGALSEDSRRWGYVRSENIIGRVVALPGGDQGRTPEWVQLSSPRAGKVALATTSGGA